MSFKENITATSSKILELLKDKENLTSWQIKVSLNISSSLLYLALGSLENQNKVVIEPDGLNYKVTKINA
ncbi:MAG: hypothetical protein J5594_00255 [Elusimicrobiaceae bacterium]|nr:hypothetical protein [Elusimicrobiaceae bacterium]